MSRYVVFLRGMNLGRRRIKNPKLCTCFVEMGFTDVSAFLASGNVLFEASGTRVERLSVQIEEGLESSLGYAVPTFLRTGDEVRAIAGYEPFTAEELAAGGKPQVALLGGRPGRAARETVLGLATPEDRLAIHHRELYWLPSRGILDSELDLALVEKTLGVWTMRTKRTLERLAVKLDPPEADSQ